jgi:hypothetical protein
MGHGLRIVSDPIAPVDTAAQVFGKMAVNMPADSCCSILGFDYDSVHISVNPLPIIDRFIIIVNKNITYYNY